MAPVLPWSCAVTSAKFDSEFPEQLAADGMSDAAFRTHAEAIMWVYHVEAWDQALPIPGVHPSEGDNDMVVTEGISRSL